MTRLVAGALPGRRRAAPAPAVLLALALAAGCSAGPLPNVTITEITTKAPTCAIGDVVYALGEQFTGSGPCERCSCAADGVRCARRRCEPRAGCKAVHRPDSCCPTYQCECEQEGRVYANGEKLVDPQDPCRVCYCQGGEVVCRRIACFVRDDCRPRLVPGRCCPEYDNCPLRGVSSAPGTAPSMPSISTVEDVSVSDDPPTSLPEKTKPEITIKEITPVSEIPIVTDVKIKEVLPSQSIEIAEYPSSRSPLIPREATSESPIIEAASLSGESSSVAETALSTPVLSTASSEIISTSIPMDINKSTLGPSKITLSTLDLSSAEAQATSASGSTSAPATGAPSTTRNTLVEEEDSALLLDHNPAFPPLPDDLSVLNNHGDETAQDTNADGDHVSSNHDMVSIPSELPLTETSSTTLSSIPKASPTHTPTEEYTTVTEGVKHETTTYKKNYEQVLNSEPTPTIKSSPMLNLRSAIPKELLNVPLSESEEINGELDEDEATDTSVAVTSLKIASNPAPSSDEQAANSELTTKVPPVDPAAEAYVPITTILHPKQAITSSASSSHSASESTTESQNIMTTTEISPDQITVSNSNIGTEPISQITTQREISSLPVETSDQNPHVDRVSDVTIAAAAAAAATAAPVTASSPQATATSLNIVTTEAEPIANTEFPTTSKPISNENYETTEMLTSFETEDTSTDSIELLTNANGEKKSAPIIDKSKNSNVLNDLIKLVGDVASISDHADEPQTTKAFSDSEELIPVNAGYKSKNSNWNLNSITEPPKGRSPTASPSKGKIVEIEDDEAHVSELPAGARAEPTTQRPVIDHVADDAPAVANTTQKDIEIINKSYVPTINRRPTKVVMKTDSEAPETDSTESPFAASMEEGTETPQ